MTLYCNAARALRIGPVVALVLTLVTPAQAYIPRAERVAKAAAEVNRASSRTQALKLEVSMRVGDSEPVANGEIVTHPTGLARLELRGKGDLIERHLLRGTEHLASRNGEQLRSPRPFLPPLFLLQAESALTFRTALRTYGIEVEQIGLAPCGNRDCFVLGDPRRTVPAAIADPATADLAPLEPRAPELEGDRPRRAMIWLDNQTFEVIRIDSSDGVRVTFGPIATFGTLGFPQWIRIDQPGQTTVQFDVSRAAAVNAPPTAFGNEWLDAVPLSPEASESGVQ
jgi:hypothetical protein